MPVDNPSLCMGLKDPWNIGLKTHADFALKKYHLYMKKFFSVLVFCCLLFVPPCAHAQKWRAFKQALVTPKTKIMFYSVQRKAEAAILRHAAARTRAFVSAGLIKSEGVPSLAAFAPKKTDLVDASHLPFPFQKNDREMYRGMALDAEGNNLRHILQNGLEVTKSHYENFAAYDGKGYPDGTLAIYAAHRPDHAKIFMWDTKGVESYLPFILHIKKVGWRPTVSVPHDIPPSWIYRVSALLKVDGKLRWGEVKLQGDNFVFTPYAPSRTERK